MRKKRKNSTEYRSLVVGVVAMSLTICVLIFLAGTQDSMNIKVARFGLQQNTIGQANSMNTLINYAYSSIQVSAVTVARELKEADREGLMQVLDEIAENTPFSEVYYINDNGIRLSRTGTTYVGKYPFYKNAMNGEKGFYLDINPDYADEPIMIFYAPLMDKDGILGVVVGLLRGSETFRPMFTNIFNGQQLYGFIIDENKGILTCNVDFKKGTYLSDSTLEVIDEEKAHFMDEIEKATSETFSFMCPVGDGLGCVSYIGDSGLRLVQILPAEGLNRSLSSAKRYTYIAFGLIMLIALVVLVLIVDDSKKRLQKDLNTIKLERDEQLSLLLSMADVYYSMHYIDLRDYSYIEYTAHNQVKELAKKFTNAKTLLYEVMHVTMTPEYLTYSLEFTDLDTLPDRMQNKKTTYTDLLGSNIGWIRLSFITIEADKDGRPIKVMVTTQAIDDEKKREQSLIYKSITDELTGISNRRAYEDDVAEYNEKDLEENFVFISMDVNELKVANDTYGHAVGDDLLRGAVACMRQCIGSFGKLYRVGGDEFAAIIFATDVQLESIKKDFEDTVTNWSTDSINHLSVSCGYVSKKEAGDKNIQEIIKLADQKMYEAKSLYYKNKGIDRRGQAVTTD